MKKLSIVLTMLLAFSFAFASDSDILIYMLRSDQVKAELERKDIKAITFSKENISTIWIFRAGIETVEDGLGPNGPEVHPCFTDVEVVSIGAFAKTDLLEPTTSTVCAENSPNTTASGD